MSNLPAATTPIFATDEDLAVDAGGDYNTLCPQWQTMASGTDGFFSPSSPWVLHSTLVNFGSNQVNPNQVVLLSGPKTSFPGGGQLLAIDSVSTDGTNITLRRLHKDLNVGQPPAPAAGITGVTFTINTFDPQLENASYILKKRFTIDENMPFRASSWVYDLREFRQATVWTVLCDRYSQEARTQAGDFPMKYARAKQKLAEVIDRIQVSWGPFGNSAEAATIFSCKVSR